MELEDQRRQVQELTSSKKQLQTELTDLKDRLEMEIISKNEESGMCLSCLNVHRSDFVWKVPNGSSSFGYRN